ncbi:MAG: hypothetical protein VYC39_09860 [Myxococcota bacterium]|nr:hypothetical protein [Myxococcota bacterium]
MSKKRPLSQREVGTLEIREKKTQNASSERSRYFPSPPPVPPVDSETTEITKEVSSKSHEEQKEYRSKEKSHSTNESSICHSNERVIVDVELPLKDDTLAALSANEKETLDTIFTGVHESRKLEDATNSPRRALQRLIYAQKFINLDTGLQEILLRLIANSPQPLEELRQTYKLTCQSGLHEISVLQQKAAVQMFEILSPLEKELLVEISQRRLGNRSVFVDTDFRDVPFVSSLDDFINKTKISAALTRQGFLHQEFVGQALQRLARPASIIRGKGGASVLRTIEFALYSDAPAEMLRYWNEVTSTTTIDLPSQHQLRLHEQNSLAHKPNLMGVVLEGLLDVAFPQGMRGQEALIMPGSSSVDVDVLARVLCEVYGLEFRIITSPAKAISFLKAKSTEHFRIPPIFLGLASEDTEYLFLFDGYNEGYTFIRAPHGGSLKQPKEKRKNPSRIVVNSNMGQDKIKNSELHESIRFVLAPKT